MALTSLSIASGSVPSTITQDGTSGTDATLQVNWGTDGTSTTYQLNIYATPVGGGTPVLIGSHGSVTTPGGSGAELIGINVDGLDPNTDYVFSVVDTQSNFASGETTAVDIAPCFAEGTLIATDRGEVPVERLRAGDLVLTMEKGPVLRPIRWIGHSRIDLTRHPDRRKAAPVAIRAGALGDGVPHRDLRVSPDHAMHLDGHLVPARLLVNGTTIVQELWCNAVTYWHVELDAHGLLVSEGAVSESYFDDGNRASFDNHSVVSLVKDFESARANGLYRAAACAPLLEDGPALAQLQRRLVSQATAIVDAPRLSASA